jgi:hypothetical protein
MKKQPDISSNNFPPPFGASASSSGPPPAAKDYSPLDPPPAFETLPNTTSLPPPAFYALQFSSPTSNAPTELAEAAWDFTEANPLAPPAHFLPEHLQSMSSGRIGFAPPPPRFIGSVNSPTAGRLSITTGRGCSDTCLISALPLYAAGYHHPTNTGRKKSVYYEITVENMPVDTAVAIGYVAIPYPGFRLPGWNRGSLGVHGDDGRRYVNDSYGGREFVRPFRNGETVGLGMSWSQPSEGDRGVRVWFMRNGLKEGDWRLDEQRDGAEENDPLPGLDGGCDVYAAVGVWGEGVRVGVRFVPEEEIREI